jgi:hypothetical protein
MYRLPHLSTKGTFLDHQCIISKHDDIDMMVTYLGASPIGADTEVTMTKGAHARFTYLKVLLGSHLQDARQSEMVGDVASMHMYRDCAVGTYLLFVVGITIFSNKAKNYVYLTYLLYLRDIELVKMYAWGTTALSCLGASIIFIPLQGAEQCHRPQVQVLGKVR